MPKKKVYNNFYFFMLEKKAEYSKKGIKYTMKQMSDIVGPVWKALKPEERTKYDDMAKEYKSQTKNGTGIGGKLASDGTKILDNLKAEERLVKEKESQHLRIRTLIGAQLDDVIGFKSYVPGMKFYVMEFNFACKIEDRDTFIPIEIGLVEFSIQNGITKSYHKVIDHGPIPMGYFGACKSHSDDYHQLFLNSEVPKEDDYCKIWNDIIEFLAPDGGQLSPVFSSHESFEVHQTSGCLHWLAKKAGEKRRMMSANEKNDYEMSEYERMEFFSLAYLLYEIRSAAANSIPMTISIDLLRGSAFDYTVGINCAFHEELDTLYCALGLAKRKCFLLLDAVCKLFDITVTSSHVPNRTVPDLEYNVYVEKPKKQSKCSVPRRVRIGDNIDLLQPTRRYALDEFNDIEEKEERKHNPPQPIFDNSPDDPSESDFDNPPQTVLYRGIGRGLFPRSIIADNIAMPSTSIPPPKLVTPNNCAVPSRSIAPPKPAENKSSESVASSIPLRSTFSDTRPELVERFARLGIGRARIIKINHE